MRLQSFYPIVVTEHLTACRDFYAALVRARGRLRVVMVRPADRR